MKYLFMLILIVLFPAQFLFCNNLKEDGILWSKGRKYEEIEAEELLVYIDNYLNMLPQLLNLSIKDKCQEDRFIINKEKKSGESVFKNLYIRNRGELVKEYHERYRDLESRIFTNKEGVSGFVDENGIIHFLLICPNGRVIDAILNNEFVNNFAGSLIVKPGIIVLYDPITGYNSILFSRRNTIWNWINRRENRTLLKIVYGNLITRRVKMESIKIWDREFKLGIYFPLFSTKTLFPLIGLLVVILSTILLIGLIIYSLLILKPQGIVRKEEIKMNEKKSDNKKEFTDIIDEIDRKVESITETSGNEIEKGVSEKESLKRETEKPTRTVAEEKLIDLEKDGIHIKILKG